MPLGLPSLPRHVWAALLLVALTLFTFGGTLNHLFVFWDDNGALVENPDFNPPKPSGLAKFWSDPLHGYRGFYVPVTYSVWWAAAHIDRTPAGPGVDTVPNPAVFHGLNLAFHAVGGVLVFLLLRKLVRADLPALFGAALFALHPLQADPVCWASSMYTPLSGLLALSALLLYLRFSDARFQKCRDVSVVDPAERHDRREPTPPTASHPHTPTSSWLPYVLATLCYALALLTKPTIILLPAIIAVIEVGLRKRRWKDCWPLLAWVAIATADALVTRHTQAAAEVYVPPLWLRPLVAGDALAFYLRKLVLPFGLIPDYGRSPRWAVGHGMIAITWLVPAALALACWRWRRKAPWLWVGSALFLAGVLPTIGLTPFDYQFYSTVADRYAYFSMLGPALIVAFALRRLTAPEAERRAGGDGGESATLTGRCHPTNHPWRRPFHPGLIAVEVALLGLAAVSRTQSGYWRDTRALFDHTLAVNPDSLIAHRQLGFVMLIGQNPAEAEAAIAHYQASLRLYPEDGGAWSNLGLLLVRQHRPAEAAEAFQRAVLLRPSEAPIHYNLGNALAAAGRPDEAAAAYGRAMRLSPLFFEADLRRAAELAAAGDSASARTHYRAALQARPDWPAAVAGMKGLKNETKHSVAAVASPPAGTLDASVNPRE